MFNVLNTAGWTNFTSYLTDDLIWTVTGETPISGNWTSRQQYIDNVFTPLNNYLAVWPTPVIVRTITQGDWATVLFDGQNGLGKNGLDYSMPYSWLMNVDTSLTTPAKIKQVVGFYDHVKVIQLFNTSYVASS
ncbi:hypothetical protein DL96DRAFT_969035 [Flagelloscypha sp. PMI_526]|nr:hypothetical protein DL96DRAFT_969035 [Flagelloscypha sp. PMI_526]